LPENRQIFTQFYWEIRSYAPEFAGKPAERLFRDESRISRPIFSYSMQVCKNRGAETGSKMEVFDFYGI
jgi:hypothetical protein